MHNYLHMSPIHINREKTKDAVAEALKFLGVKRPESKGWANGGLEWKTNDGKRQTFLLRDLLSEAQNAGFSRQLFVLIDRQDPFSGGTFLMATNSSAFNMQVTYGRYQRELHGPCRFSPLENELTEDILH